MASIFTRKAISAILNDEALTADEKNERIFGLYGQALDDGYISKSAAASAQNTAVEAAKAEAIKGIQAPNIKESEEYKALEGQFAAYKTRQSARGSDDYKGVKGKFFDAVYDMVDHGEKAKPVAEQLSAIREKYEEYFEEKKDEQQKPPQFGAPTQGSAPTGKTGPSFMDTWGFVPKKG